MKQVSLLEFRKNAERILRRVEQGERLILTRRGKPVVRMEPIAKSKAPPSDDPIYRLADLATDEGEAISNEGIDRAVYGL